MIKAEVAITALNRREWRLGEGQLIKNSAENGLEAVEQDES